VTRSASFDQRGWRVVRCGVRHEGREFLEVEQEVTIGRPLALDEDDEAADAEAAGARDPARDVDHLEESRVVVPRG
jgi:hypothetical protein